MRASWAYGRSATWARRQRHSSLYSKRGECNIWQSIIPTSFFRKYLRLHIPSMQPQCGSTASMLCCTASKRGTSINTFDPHFLNNTSPQRSRSLFVPRGFRQVTGSSVTLSACAVRTLLLFKQSISTLTDAGYLRPSLGTRYQRLILTIPSCLQSH